MKHKIAVHLLMLLWLCVATRIAYAATFAQEVRLFDYESLLTAAVGGLCGGALKTIFALANDSRPVFQVLRESRKDLVIAFLAGGFVYLAMIAVESKWPGTVTREIRFFGVLVAGWAGAAVFVQAARLARNRLDGENAKARAGAAEDPPIPAAAPLNDRSPS